MAAPTTLVTGKPCWSREGAIGDYGGSLNKTDSETEGTAPYAWFVYRELSALRGSAYAGHTALATQTLVHAEHLALARMLAWQCFRKPEQFRNDCLPGTSDQGLPYWVEVLKIPVRATDQPWQVRQRCAVHYRAITSAGIVAIQTALQELLGSAYVDASFSVGTDLATPPSLTYWPGVNAGPAEYSLGGGAWVSERSHLFVEVTWPSDMSQADFHQLVHVQAFRLLDRMLGGHCTFSVALGGGFILGVSQLDFTGLG